MRNYYRFEINGKGYRLNLVKFTRFCIGVMLVWAVVACIIINYRCSQNVPYIPHHTSVAYDSVEDVPKIDFSFYDRKAAEMPVVSKSPVKRYMDRNAVTDKSTRNYAICHKATVCDDGTIEYDGRKVIAIGQAYGKSGDKLDITLLRKNGETQIIKVIIGDSKKMKDTLNGEGWCSKDGHIIEMIVDTKNINPMSRKMGDMNYTDSVEGSVIGISRA